jgi:predicted phage terminase large subunit-like protein
VIKDNLLASDQSREWESQYQQRPRPREGSVFKVGMIGVLPAAPAGGKTVRAYDLAATKDTGTREQAWTRGVKLTLTPGGRLVVEDVCGCRGAPDEVERLMINTAGQDGRGVKIGIPQDPGQSGKSQVLYLTRQLHGFTVQSSPETGDKEERAGPIASQVNVGNLDLVQGPWNRAFLAELGAFPAGATKDQVDALSRAYSMLIETGRPLILSSDALRRLASTPQRDRFSGMQTLARNRFGRAR